MVAALESFELAPKYRIGTVVQLTGLTADTIRAWERRYESIVPSRTPGGTRLYSDEDVARLQLMRALTELGDSIGSVAKLESDDLRARLARIASSGSTSDSEPEARGERQTVRTALLDATLGEQFECNAGEAPDLEVVCSARDLESFLGEVRNTGADVVVMHLSCIDGSPLDALAACLEASQARIAVVLYEFAPRKVLSRLAACGARLIRGPVSVAHVRRSILDLGVIERAGRTRFSLDEEPGFTLRAQVHLEPPARHYSDTQIARLREVHSAVDCECPNHLAQLVTSLLAFEDYSARCESRSPEEADLHGSLRRATGHARALMERMIVRLCDQDGIRI